jgi:hypothetical protein
MVACSFEPTKDAKEVTISNDSHTLRIGTALGPEQEDALLNFIQENFDVFAWKPSNMLGISRDVAEHKLNIKTGAGPIKQKLRRFNSDKCKAVGEKIKKLLSTGFVREVYHPKWLANLVLVKKNVKWRMCVDYMRLNKVCPKDLFPLPCIDQVVDSTAVCETLCFLDTYSSYHQIVMDLADQLATSFKTPFGCFSYSSVPFGLKNIGATFQRCMQCIFGKLIR